MTFYRKLLIVPIYSASLIGVSVLPCFGQGGRSLPQVEAFRPITSRIYSSGEPVGVAQFQQIAAHGIEVVISVDGKVPDQKAAAKAGLKYLHLPIGYDGVPPSVQAALRQVLTEESAPILIHCHHGKHRAPAAAAVAAMLDVNLPNDQALQLLKEAGTGTEYKGLWRDVREFDAGKLKAQPAPLLSEAKVDALVREMSHLGESFETLEKLVTSGHAKSKASELIVQIQESYRESVRLTANGDYSKDLQKKLSQAADKVQELKQTSLQDSGLIKEALAQIKQDCKSCHTVHRN